MVGNGKISLANFISVLVIILALSGVWGTSQYQQGKQDEAITTLKRQIEMMKKDCHQ